jgi:hypothetical protein
MTGRVCQREACAKPIDHLRADAHYCSKSCRREASRERAAKPEGTRPFDWTHYRLVHRTRAPKRPQPPARAGGQR